MRPILFLVSCLVVLGGLATQPHRAQAATGSCLAAGVAERCTVWTGKVTFIDDADTLRVDLDRDGSRRPIKVRVTGIQAMEQTVYTSNPARRRGQCHAVEATARLEALIRRSRWRVRLSAQDPSSRSGVRWRRSVAVKWGGRWRDVGRRLVAEGHALWLPNGTEWAWNRDYSRLSAQAATKGVGLWNTAHCGAGPHQESPLRVVVNADADGNDNDFLNGEWVKVRNLDPVNAVSLGGWWLRDSALRRFTFPPYATLGPNEELTVFVGDGQSTWTEFFWGQRRGVFENAVGDRGMGDGAYLFDPQGDLRAAMVYPCRLNCVHPYRGVIGIEAKARGREWVTLRNLAGFPVDLDGLRMESLPYSYAFPRASVLQPGEEMRIYVEGDPGADTRLERHWGETGPILNNRGDVVRLRSFDDIEVACAAYGDRAC